VLRRIEPSWDQTSTKKSGELTVCPKMIYRDLSGESHLTFADAKGPLDQLVDSNADSNPIGDQPVHQDQHARSPA